MLPEQDFGGFEEDGTALIDFIPELKLGVEAFDKVRERFSILAAHNQLLKISTGYQQWYR